jgi:hypothetical protein
MNDLTYKKLSFYNIKHKALEYEAFNTSMFGKNHDGVCYSLKDNHENGHMQTIKHT